MLLKRRVGVVRANGRGRSRSRESDSLREDRETMPRPSRESASITLVVGLHSKKVRRGISGRAKRKAERRRTGNPA